MVVQIYGGRMSFLTKPARIREKTLYFVKLFQ